MSSAHYHPSLISSIVIFNWIEPYHCDECPIFLWRRRGALCRINETGSDGPSGKESNSFQSKTAISMKCRTQNDQRQRTELSSSAGDNRCEESSMQWNFVTSKRQRMTIGQVINIDPIVCDFYSFAKRGRFNQWQSGRPFRLPWTAHQSILFDR